jgi:hypothetical protein
MFPEWLCRCVVAMRDIREGESLRVAASDDEASDDEGEVENDDEDVDT